MAGREEGKVEKARRNKKEKKNERKTGINE